MLTYFNAIIYGIQSILLLLLQKELNMLRKDNNLNELKSWFQLNQFIT